MCTAYHHGLNRSIACAKAEGCGPGGVIVCCERHEPNVVHEQRLGALQAVRPENVVLEVCRSRTAIIYDHEPQPGSDHAAEPNSMSLRSAASTYIQSCMVKERCTGHLQACTKVLPAHYTNNRGDAVSIRSAWKSAIFALERGTPN